VIILLMISLFLHFILPWQFKNVLPQFCPGLALCSMKSLPWLFLNSIFIFSITLVIVDLWFQFLNWYLYPIEFLYWEVERQRKDLWFISYSLRNSVVCQSHQGLPECDSWPFLFHDHIMWSICNGSFNPCG